ncbi:MAG: hypothetical protein GY731_17435 [Gammaproteobacteria bacterium]|nr:hypothetical protein [Gammaproteobacteria bacterium]
MKDEVTRPGFNDNSTELDLSRRRFLGTMAGLAGSATALSLVLKSQNHPKSTHREADFYRPLPRSANV